MHEKKFHGEAEKLRSEERLALLEVDRVVKSCLDGLSVRNVLDVGTGTGLFAETFARQRLAVTGIDSNPDLLKLARHFVPSAVLREAMAESLPFRERSFDLVFLGHVLHEVDDPGKVLAEARRVAAVRVSVLEWPYRTEVEGPPLEHRLAPEAIEELARGAGYREINRSALTHMVLYHLAP